VLQQLQYQNSVPQYCMSTHTHIHTHTHIYTQPRDRDSSSETQNVPHNRDAVDSESRLDHSKLLTISVAVDDAAGRRWAESDNGRPNGLLDNDNVATDPTATAMPYAATE
jgi:hypothetical protein